MQQGIHTISFVGLGLIGASLMQALKRAAEATGRTIEMIGFDPGFDAEDIAAIIGEYGLDSFEPDPAKLYDADLVVLCAPVVTNIALLDEAKRYIREDTVVSDVSSTKAEIAAKARELGIEFIGMHPIAGREQQGYRAASPELLDGRLVILCPDSDDETATELAGLLRAAGCSPLFMSPEEHDRVYANISHLPQLISTALMAHCRENVEWAGPGFASMARLAGSPWAVWRDIVSTNRRNIADEMEAFSALLAEVAGEVRDGNFDALESKFCEANDLYQRLQERSCL
ncbi:prephenate dehydrogenase/arogenate dehydrogenase family protein [Chlorobaculum sp. MV4-Y]|jgi:prephenate dehydrogenase|uniref:prephenate dehydrogenase n=1 Tax=Chlorobaculum sp. MV4-Y TaxID=2976335 RepID=UPI0021B03277|nr:prephenate dehydrogenase/arogenate dehydrogenase family protein [Chlorobaculum sp. MV4-Y]UWX57714.1 prephenate dehydrogenase/arogenate dehydrogenase family protein [Chlorobaculum sp. MV4-Y]